MAPMLARWHELREPPPVVHCVISVGATLRGEQILALAPGIDPIVFGSDFPHGEGLARPGEYAAAQLGSFSDGDVKRIMRDNLENFLVGAS